MKKFALLLIVILCFSLTGCDSSNYKKAITAFEAEDYDTADLLFESLGDYKESMDYRLKINQHKSYLEGTVAISNSDYEKAISVFKELGDYEDSLQLLSEAKYQQAGIFYEEGNYRDAFALYSELESYKDSEELAKSASNYLIAYLGLEAYKDEDYDAATSYFEEVDGVIFDDIVIDGEPFNCSDYLKASRFMQLCSYVENNGEFDENWGYYITNDSPVGLYVVSDNSLAMMYNDKDIYYSDEYHFLQTFDMLVEYILLTNPLAGSEVALGGEYLKAGGYEFNGGGDYKMTSCTFNPGDLDMDNYTFYEASEDINTVFAETYKSIIQNISEILEATSLGIGLDFWGLDS